MGVETKRETYLSSREMRSESEVEEIVRAFVTSDYGRVVATVAAATRSNDGAEDAVQDAIVKALATDPLPENLRAWVTVVAINRRRDLQRRATAERRAVDRLDAPAASDPTTGVAERSALLGAIDHLPERQRQIVLLHYYLDASVADIAAALDVSPGTVKTQLHRGRAALADHIGGAS